MQLVLTKKEDRATLNCYRMDGTQTGTDLGPELPFHDLAHYVVESTLHLQKGFFAHIASGYSIQELSDKEVIKGLPKEIMFSEIVTRVLQSIGSGACKAEEAHEVVQEELKVFPDIPSREISEDEWYRMIFKFTSLTMQFINLGDSESLKLEFNLPQNQSDEI